MDSKGLAERKRINRYTRVSDPPAIRPEFSVRLQTEVNVAGVISASLSWTFTQLSELYRFHFIVDVQTVAIQ